MGIVRVHLGCIAEWYIPDFPMWRRILLVKRLFLHADENIAHISTLSLYLVAYNMASNV